MGFLTRLVATFFPSSLLSRLFFFYLPACSAFSAPSLWLLIVESDITNTFSVSQLQLLRVVAGRPFPYDKDQCLLLFLIPDIIANEIPAGAEKVLPYHYIIYILHCVQKSLKKPHFYRHEQR